MFVFFSSRGNSLIGLTFPPSFVVYCFCSCEVRSDLVSINVCSDLMFGDVCSILLPTMRSDIFGSLLLLNRRGRRTCSRYLSQPLSSLDFLEDGRDIDCLP